MSEKLARRGEVVPAAYHPDPLRAVRLGAAMAALDATTVDGVRLGDGDGDGVTIGADEPLEVALRLLVDEEVDHLVVVAGGETVGVLGRADLLRVRARQPSHDHPEPAALGRLRARRAGRGRQPVRAAPGDV